MQEKTTIDKVLVQAQASDIFFEIIDNRTSDMSFPTDDEEIENWNNTILKVYDDYSEIASQFWNKNDFLNEMIDRL